MIDEVKPIMRGLRDSEECWIDGLRDLNVETGVAGVETDERWWLDRGSEVLEERTGI